MKHFLLPERWERIVSLAEARGSVSVEELAEELNISTATVRRDLARIQERGLIARTWGGAAPRHVTVGPTLAESRTINPRQKECIGRAAAELVHPDDSVLIDGGFTAYQAARALPAPLQVVTNSLDVAHALAGREGISLVVIGGNLSAASGTMVGPLTESQLELFHVDKAILGTDALSVEEGLSSPNSQTAQTKRAMIARARERIVVADSSKLGRFALYAVAPLESITTLVTDDQAEPELLEQIRAHGVEVIVASQEGI